MDAGDRQGRLTRGLVRGARALGGALALLAVAAVAAPGARAATQPVTIEFAAFSPSAVDALPGDTVTWKNSSVRTHTVFADAGAFASGELAPGDVFSFAPAAVGTFAYHCTIHPGMTGVIEVRHVTLGPLSAAPQAPGAPLAFDGRTDDPAHPVTVERDTGAGFAPVATATPTADGHWAVTLHPTATADYRAVSAAGSSETRRALVDRRVVHLRATRTGVAVRVTPSDPGGRILLQVHSRVHFGWWPLARKRLDFVSEASFRVPTRRRVRALLVDRDGWTPLARSHVVRTG